VERRASSPGAAPVASFVITVDKNVHPPIRPS
jgi:hypothetical protein